MTSTVSTDSALLLTEASCQKKEARSNRGMPLEPLVRAMLTTTFLFLLTIHYYIVLTSIRAPISTKASICVHNCYYTSPIIFFFSKRESQQSTRVRASLPVPGKRKYNLDRFLLNAKNNQRPHCTLKQDAMLKMTMTGTLLRIDRM